MYSLKDCARRFVLLKLTTDRYEASRGLFATAKLLVQLHNHANTEHTYKQWFHDYLVIKLSNQLPTVGPLFSSPSFLVPHFQVLLSCIFHPDIWSRIFGPAFFVLSSFFGLPFSGLAFPVDPRKDRPPVTHDGIGCAYA